MFGGYMGKTQFQKIPVITPPILKGRNYCLETKTKKLKLVNKAKIQQS